MKQVMIVDMQPIGSLQIFVLLSDEDYAAMVSFENRVYWTDHKSPTPQGPFANTYEATKNFVSVAQTRRHLEEMTWTNIIPTVPATTMPTVLSIVLINDDKVISMAEWKSKSPKHQLKKVWGLK
jgi:hypothetical protein